MVFLSVSPSILCIQWNPILQGKKALCNHLIKDSATMQAQKGAELRIHSTLLGFPTLFSAWFSYLDIFFYTHLLPVMLCDASLERGEEWGG